MTKFIVIEGDIGRDAAPSGPKDLSPGFVARSPLVSTSGITTRGVAGDLDGDGDNDLVVGTYGRDEAMEVITASMADYVDTFSVPGRG